MIVRDSNGATITESIAGVFNAQFAIDVYKRVMQYKSEEEIKDEQIKVKALLPSHCGKYVDVLI